MRDVLVVAAYPTFLLDSRDFQHSLIGTSNYLLVIMLYAHTLTLLVDLVSTGSNESLGVGNTDKPYLRCFDICAVKTI